MKTIMVAVDGSQSSSKAARLAADYAEPALVPVSVSSGSKSLGS